jgi:hypothetical protein
MQRVDGKELPALTSLGDGETLAQYRTRVRADLGRADRALSEHAGKKPVAFAYPFGAYGADRTNDPRVRAALRGEIARRYALAFQQDDQDKMALATPYDERTELRRLEVGDWSAHQLMQKVAAAAERTSAAMRARQDALQQQIDDGAELPTGIVESSPPAATRSASAAPRRTSSAPSATAAFTPSPVAAAPANDPPAPPPPTPTTWTTQPPPGRPPTTSPPTTSAPPGRSDDAPGHSTDPPGNGRGGKK